MGTALNVQAWSTTANSNDGADSTIGTVANTSSPTSVDDWVKGLMASVKKHSLDNGGGITAGGTADVLTITTNQAISSAHQAAGFSVRFKAASTNTGAATVNVDTIGAASIKRLNGDALSAGDITAGGIYDLAFDGTNYILMGAGTGSGTYGTLSGANTWSAINTFSAGIKLGASTAINFNSSDVLISHAANLLSFSGGSLGYYFDAPLYVSSNVVYRAGGTDVATTDGGTGTSAATTAILADFLLDSLGSEVTGALIYHNGTSWVVLAPP
jgi:hypothetical protein